MIKDSETSTLSKLVKLGQNKNAQLAIATTVAFAFGRLTSPSATYQELEDNLVEASDESDGDLDLNSVDGEFKETLHDGYVPVPEAWSEKEELAQASITDEVNGDEEAEQLMANLTALLTEINTSSESEEIKSTISTTAPEKQQLEQETEKTVAESTVPSTDQPSESKTKAKATKDQSEASKIEAPVEKQKPASSVTGKEKAKQPAHEVKKHVAADKKTQEKPAVVTYPSGKITHVVGRGDNLTFILKRYKVKDLTKVVVDLLDDRRARRALSRLKPGQKLELYIEDRKLVKLITPISPTKDLHMVKNSRGRFYPEFKTKQVDDNFQVISGVVQNNFYLSGRNAGLSPAQIATVSRALSSKIDFNKGIRKGDLFSVLFKQQKTKDGVKIGSPEIVAMSFRNKNKTVKMFKHVDNVFYTADGDTEHSGFLRKPLSAYRRISSHFNANRKHPVTGRRAPHNGTDFAAPVGTPVFAGASGTVVVSGYKKLNGNYIVIEHGKHVTKYLHLSSRNVKKGQKVVIGEEIGAVGNTGRSTGPHLHYEIHINGRPVNPLKAKLPTTRQKKNLSKEGFASLVEEYSNYI